MRSPACQRPRVLFVLKWRDQPYGSDWGDKKGDVPLSSGLYNSARFVAEMLAQAGVPTKLVHVVDGNDVHRELVAFGATHVVIEAFWCPPYKFDDLYKASPDVQFIVRNHSETPFLAQEGIAFGWTIDYLKRPNVVVAPNSPRMLADTRFWVAQAFPQWSDAEVARKVPYLPNVYPAEAVRYPRKRSDGYLDVGCFGAVRPLKNTLLQAFGALIYARETGRRLNFHVNGGRLEMGGSPILKNLQSVFDAVPCANLMSHDWMPHEAFQSLIARMDVVTQVTFSETFNIVAADAVSQGVPIVTSREVAWADQGCFADPTDARSVAASIGHALNDPQILARSLAGLARSSTEARDLWLARFG